MSRFRPCLAVYLILKKNDSILLMRRHNTGYEDGKLSLPAGHVDEGESAIDAMVREAKEEIGVTINPEQLELVYTLHRKSVNDVYVDLWFMCEDFSGNPGNMEPHKCSELLWSDEEFLPDDLQETVKKVLGEYRENAYGDMGL